MRADRRGDIESVAIAYDHGALTGDAASRDVVEQMRAVEDALRRNRIGVTRIGVDLNLADFKRRLEETRPDLVFNLVESLDGSDRMQTTAPMLLENWGFPFTGCGSFAMALSNNKLESKRLLAAKGLPAAECAWLDASGELRFLPDDGWCRGGCDCIVKAVEEHASSHLDDASVLRGVRAAGLAARLRLEKARIRTAVFAERYIDGREFNLSLIEKPGGGAEAFPVAEISFDALPPDRERIVGYAAKWDEDSEEYAATPRTFLEGEDDLAAELRRAALATWDAFGLSGYARVDFRVDADGRPFVLEANANPCLAPDAGFAAAALRGGVSYEELVLRLAGLALGAARGGRG